MIGTSCPYFISRLSKVKKYYRRKLLIVGEVCIHDGVGVVGVRGF